MSFIADDAAGLAGERPSAVDDLHARVPARRRRVAELAAREALSQRVAGNDPVQPFDGAPTTKQPPDLCRGGDAVDELASLSSRQHDAAADLERSLVPQPLDGERRDLVLAVVHAPWTVTKPCDSGRRYNAPAARAVGIAALWIANRHACVSTSMRTAHPLRCFAPTTWRRRPPSTSRPSFAQAF
jgi:hypothetical protein